MKSKSYVEKQEELANKWLDDVRKLLRRRRKMDVAKAWVKEGREICKGCNCLERCQQAIKEKMKIVYHEDSENCVLT